MERSHVTSQTNLCRSVRGEEGQPHPQQAVGVGIHDPYFLLCSQTVQDGGSPGELRKAGGGSLRGSHSHQLRGVG
jgi:hypothetical protein